jgi:hypothetical protein
MLHSIILYTKQALSLSFEHVVAMVTFIAMKRPYRRAEPTALTLSV